MSRARKVSETLDWNWNKVVLYDNWIVKRWSNRTWKQISQPWVKEWTVVKNTRWRVEMLMHKIKNMIYYGVKRVKSEKNKMLWIKPNTPLNIMQACNEVWMTATAFYSALRKYPDLKAEFTSYRENRREVLKLIAEENMMEVISTWDLTDKERFDASFKVAQATMREYNPKTEVETKSVSINLSKSTDDLIWELKALLWN